MEHESQRRNRPRQVDSNSGEKASSPLSRSEWILHVLAWLPIIAIAASYLLIAPFRESIDEALRLMLNGDRAGLRELGNEWGVQALLFTGVLMIIQAIIAPIPAVLITITNSLLFGWFWGGVYSIVTATIGAWICFDLSRLFGESVVRRILPQRVFQRADTFMAKHGAASILIARLLPFVPFDPISFVAGLTRISRRSFVVATLVGQLPAGFAYAYLAHIEDPRHLSWVIPLTLVGLAVFGLVARTVILIRYPAAQARSETNQEN